MRSEEGEGRRRDEREWRACARVQKDTVEVLTRLAGRLRRRERRERVSKEERGGRGGGGRGLAGVGLACVVLVREGVLTLYCSP